MILGDTSDPSPMLSLTDPSEKIDVLVHESTGTAVIDINPSVNSASDTEESMSKKMRERGHSTSFMAGQFARQINASRMVMNHVGGKFPSPLGCVCPNVKLSKLVGLPQLSEDKNQTSKHDLNKGASIYDTCLKATHAVLWKTYEEMAEDRRKKIVQEITWLRSVAADAANGWRSFKKPADHEKDKQDNMVGDPQKNENDTKKADHQDGDRKGELEVVVAHDFLQVKVPRPDIG